MPNTWDGNKCSNGKKMKPVTLVATVLTKKIAVQPLSRSAASSPHQTTTNPERMPTRLITTCTNVSGDIPKIIIFTSFS
jgi:hypothetical protein